MTHYLFIESNDPLENRGVESYLDTALDLRRRNRPVTVFFVENGAHAARAGAGPRQRQALLQAGATLKVDRFALSERGIPEGRLAPGVDVGDVEQIVDLLADGDTKAVWH